MTSLRVIHAVKIEEGALETECGLFLQPGILATGWGRTHRTYVPNADCEDCKKALSEMSGSTSTTEADCTCFYTDPKTWLSAASLGYGSGYEPGSMMEQNPECPVHPIHPLESHMTDMHIGPAGPADDQIAAQDQDPREPIYDMNDLLPEAPTTPEFEEAVRNAVETGYDAVLSLVKGVDHNARNWGVAHAREGLLGIQPDWALALPIQMQSVLLLSTRGCDGIRKHHPSKYLVRMYRACVIRAAAARRMLEPGDDVHDTFMDARDLASPLAFQDAVGEYFTVVDELPFHYHLHLVHAAEILGYKHPNESVAAMWMGFYLKAVDDMHLAPESEEQLNARLNDFGKFIWGQADEPPTLDEVREEHAQMDGAQQLRDGWGEGGLPMSATPEAPGEGYTDPSEGHDHPSEAVCFLGCRGYDAVQAEKTQAAVNASDAFIRHQTNAAGMPLPQELDVASRALPQDNAPYPIDSPAGIQAQSVAPPQPVVLCGQKQGGSNSPCIKPKGHMAPHHDGNYVW